MRGGFYFLFLLRRHFFSANEKISLRPEPLVGYTLSQVALGMRMVLRLVMNSTAGDDFTLISLSVMGFGLSVVCEVR